MKPDDPQPAQFHSSVLGHVVGQMTVWPPHTGQSPFLVGPSNGNAGCAAGRKRTVPARETLRVVVCAGLAPACFAAGFLGGDLAIQIGVLLIRQ